MKFNTIPVIDMSELQSKQTLALLDKACRDWGFFQVINHGIPQGVINSVIEAAQDFFALPIEAKHKISCTRENPWGFNYEPVKNAQDWKQRYDFGPAQGHQIRPQWPQGKNSFRQSVQAYYRFNERLAFRLLAAISTNLGMSPGYLSQGFGSRHSSFLRLDYDPVCAASQGSAMGKKGNLLVGPHTDSGALTLLVQDGQQGLQVFRNQQWHPVEPEADAIVVNIGDMVQVWSNDHYCSALHRVAASAEKPRLSVPFFLNPEYGSNYGPLPTMISEDRPERYRKMNWGAFRRKRAKDDFSAYGTEMPSERYKSTG